MFILHKRNAAFARGESDQLPQGTMPPEKSLPWFSIGFLLLLLHLLTAGVGLRWYLLVGFAYLGGLLLVAGWRSERYRSQGQRVIGEITEATIEVDREGSDLLVRYTFSSPHSGQRIEDKVRVMRSRHPGKLPDAGTPAAVLYVDDTEYMLL